MEPKVLIMLKRILPAVVGMLILGVVLYQPKAEDERTTTMDPPDHYDDVARMVADVLPRVHLSHEPFTDELARKAFTNYINTLDFDHTVFMKSQVDELHLVADELENMLEDGELDFAYKVYALLLENMEDRVAYVDTLLTKGFDVEREETYAWKRKAEPFPATEEERNDLWRKKIKHEYIARKVSAEMKKREAAEKPEEKPEEKPDEGAEEVAPKKVDDRSPEELILKKYQQYLTVLKGNDEEWVLQAFLNSFTRAYDPHSAYLSPRAKEDFEVTMNLKLKGIGALLTVEDGAAKIQSLIKGGPAARDGRLKPGDKIIAVAQKASDEPIDIMYMPLYKSVRLIRGEVGSSVFLSIIPASDISGTTVEVIDLVRAEIKLEDRAAKSEIRDQKASEGEKVYKLGIIELPDFYADLSGRRNGKAKPRSSARDVRNLLKQLVVDEVDGVLIDLRDNGGGSLPDAIEMAGLFIGEGPIVQVKAQRRTRALPDPDPANIYDGPLVILVNRHSASASEIVAAALQDFGRAVIVGDSRTHGKGSVQSLFALDRFDTKFGSVKLTTAGFYRIDGGSTQLRGVRPDVVIPSALDVMEIGEEFLPNVLDWSMVDAADYEASNSLEKVLGTLRENSVERREGSEDFEHYNKMVERLRLRLENKKMSLNLKDRLAQAERDRELEEFQNTALVGDDAEDVEEHGGIKDEPEDESEDESGGEPEKEKKRKDIILDETLEILRDLVELYPGL